MSCCYAHALIPKRVDYKPAPSRVASFFAALSALGAAPARPAFEVVTDAEKITWVGEHPIRKPIPRRAGRGPITRTSGYVGNIPPSAEVVPITRRDHTAVEGVSGLASELEALDQYDAVMSGEGPPELPILAFAPSFDSGGEAYPLAIRCCLRPVAVSTSDGSQFSSGERPVWAGGVAKEPGLWDKFALAPFGDPCVTTDRTGYFKNHMTAETIEVPEAGCARFWVEFTFGNWMLPTMESSSLDLLPPAIVEAGEQTFEIGFSQGCHWG